MKITKRTYPEQLEQRKLAANVGCDVCPCCGETKSTVYYYFNQHDPKSPVKGIYETHSETWRSKFLSTKKYLYRTDKYTCYTCGCKWESEEYVVEEANLW